MIALINFFTAGPYEREAVKMASTAAKCGIQEAAVLERGPFDSWKEAVCHKPKFIREMFDKYPKYDGYLWVDADARFTRQPPWQEFEDCHIGYHPFKRTSGHAEEILTGTLYFANTPTVRDFLDDWIEATPAFQHTDTPEQHSINQVLGRWKGLLVEKRLGPEWCFIHDDMKTMHPNIDPIITHYQASRRLRSNAGRK